jgi:hypothetical protein
MQEAARERMRLPSTCGGFDSGTAYAKKKTDEVQIMLNGMMPNRRKDQ